MPEIGWPRQFHPSRLGRLGFKLRKNNPIHALCLDVFFLFFCFTYSLFFDTCPFRPGFRLIWRKIWAENCGHEMKIPLILWEEFVPETVYWSSNAALQQHCNIFWNSESVFLIKTCPPQDSFLLHNLMCVLIYWHD